MQHKHVISQFAHISITDAIRERRDAEGWCGFWTFDLVSTGALLKIPAHQPSIFRDLVEETGSQSARKLIRMASTQSLTKKLSSKEMLFTFDE